MNSTTNTATTRAKLYTSQPLTVVYRGEVDITIDGRICWAGTSTEVSAHNGDFTEIS